MRLTPQQWRALLRWFVRGAPSAEIARETRLDRKRVLRALTVVRQAMLRSAPADVPGVSDTEIAPEPASEPHERASPQNSVTLPKGRFAALGLSTAHGHAWAYVIPDVDSDQLGRMLLGPNDRQSIVIPALDRYTAVVHRRRLYRLADSAGRAPFGQIEAFWAYLQRQLRAKGGIRRERLGLYLAEFAWRYNHRRVPPAEQVRELLTLIGRPRLQHFDER